jgi:Zn-dependent protease
LAVTAAGAVLTTFGAETGPLAVTGTVLFILGGWAVSLCLHEFGHAIIAYRGGDYSVAGKGYLTLDIRHYTDPVLSIVLPLVLLAFGGIPLPGGAVWINHHSLRSKGVQSMVSLAGPSTNLVLGLLLAGSVAIFNPSVALAAALSYLAYLQIIAFVLNMLPIPGLDGWGIWEPYLPYKAQQFGAKVRPWAPLALFAALFAFPAVASVFFVLGESVFELIGGRMGFAGFGQSNFMFWR